MIHQAQNSKDDDRDREFKARARESIDRAIAHSTDALVFIGGNSQGCNIRQKAIFDLVNECHEKGIKAYWYKTPHNARLDITDQIIPGLSYILVDFDIMSISDSIVQSALDTVTS